MKQKKRFFKRSKAKINTRQKEIVEKPEKPQKPKESPKINRIIPVNLKNGILSLLIFFGLMAFIWTGILLYQSYLSWFQLMSQRNNLTSKMHLWENIAKAYPNYRDAYVEGEIYAYMLGNKEKEQYFLNKLRLLDPSSSLIKTFEQLITLQKLNQN